MHIPFYIKKYIYTELVFVGPRCYGLLAVLISLIWVFCVNKNESLNKTWKYKQ